MRVVLDTNVLVRAGVMGKGPARELLQTIVASPQHTLLLSPFLLRELERARDTTEIVFPGSAPRVVPFDPDDDPVVHTAIVGQADVLCTLNRHFFHSDVLEYCRARGVLVASDIDLLKLFRM